MVDTASGAVGAGLAGFSIEDSTGESEAPIFELEVAVERVAAAAAAAHQGAAHVVLTARYENHVHGRDDLADTIARLQAYEEAGADVLYAPGLTAAQDIEAVVKAVRLPINVLALAGGPTVGELAALGVSRVSVGGAFAFAALGAVVDAAQELRDHGTYGYATRAAGGSKAARSAFG